MTSLALEYARRRLLVLALPCDRMRALLQRFGHAINGFRIARFDENQCAELLAAVSAADDRVRRAVEEALEANPDSGLASRAWANLWSSHAEELARAFVKGDFEKMAERYRERRSALAREHLERLRRRTTGPVRPRHH